MNKAFVTMDDDVVTMVFQLFVVIVCQIQGRAEDFFLPVAITFLTTPGKFLTARRQVKCENSWDGKKVFARKKLPPQVKRNPLHAPDYNKVKRVRPVYPV